MLEIKFTERALQDLAEITAFGYEYHSPTEVVRYNKLIEHCLISLSENPNQISINETYFGLKRFHLKILKKEVVYEGAFVQDPSHFIFFRTIEGNVLEIVRIIREGRNFLQHLEDFS